MSTSKQVILNMPELLVVSAVSNTIELQGESVAFKNVNMVITNSTTVPLSEANNLFKVFDNGGNVDVTYSYPGGALSPGFNVSLAGNWYIPDLTTDIAAGYSTSSPGASVGGLVLTNSTIPSSFTTSINNWLSKLVYDNITYRYLSPADIAGSSSFSTTSAYVQHMSAVTIGNGTTGSAGSGFTTSAVSTSVFNALQTCLTGTNTGVRRSLYEQMFTQDPVRFTYGGSAGAGIATDFIAYPTGFSTSNFSLSTGFGTNSVQNMPFRANDELRFLTKFDFSQATLTPNGQTYNPTTGTTYNTIATATLSGVTITPDSRVVEFRVRIA